MRRSVSRVVIASGVVLGSVLFFCAPERVWAACASLQFCGGNQTLQPELIREPASDSPWWQPALLPNSPSLILPRDFYLSQITAAMGVWAAVNSCVPQDYLDNGVQDKFLIMWSTQAQINGDPNRRTGIAAANTTHTMDDLDHPCRITSAVMSFAFDPNDGQGNYYCWGSVGGSECAGIGVLDFETAAIHEYGHALGLAHSDVVESVMYPVLAPDVVHLSLTQCEQDLVNNVYVENFGPSVLAAFGVSRVGQGAVTCQWRALLERGCRAYRLTRSCPDGTAGVVADSVFCLGAGVSYTVSDTVPCAGLLTYTLSLVDSSGAGEYQEKVIAMRKYDAGGVPAQGARTHEATMMASAQPGYGSAEEAVEALGNAIATQDDDARARATADGFGYFSADGMYWGRIIDNILESSLRECLAASDSTIDSLAFKATAARDLSENLREVTASSHYVHRCGTVDADWDGQIIAIVERRDESDGWRVRQVTEVR